MAYSMPHFVSRVLFPKSEVAEDVEMQFKGAIAQSLSLLSTLHSLMPANASYKESPESMLYLLTGLCLLGVESERTFLEDKNAFLTQFLGTEEELMNVISVRYSTYELLEDSFFQNPSFNRKTIESVLEHYFTDSVPQAYLASESKIAELA